ncbi:Crp/Fnr family transcriptional regulator [Fodinibius sediminis]|uniref:CRP/FNR family transcriptional regulator, anaerobic regulatory protein n=1 Tax=Fodinibius sediminis TaxID=1214077 RepID=A0A521BKE2_9BACT|nr:Crp/Fnr family transcriptional regulator [Fodinibius sediminis]SMO47593.1 CRP/FNR family transcriptional regulator, anaerobic regulatory protein [Fodinibius sediminis]
MKTPNLQLLASALEKGEQLDDLGIVKQFKEGQTIVSEGANVHSIPIITKGSVKVMQSDDTHKEMVLYYLRPGETCVMSFLAGLYQGTSKIKAIAEEPCEVLFIPVARFRILIREHPEWLNYIFEIYHKRFEELLGVVDAVAFKNMDERLLQFLQKRAEVSGSRILKITHEQLAQELGTAREVVSRLLKKLEEEERVVLGRNKIRLL